MEDSTTKSKSKLFLAMILFALSLFVLVLFVITINNEVAVNRQSAKKLKDLSESANRLEHRVAYQDEYYNRLLTDEEFVRRLIKQKFEYTYPDEIVFKFKNGNLIEKSSIIE